MAAAAVAEELAKFKIVLADNINMPRASASLFGVVKAAEKEFKRFKREQTSAVEKNDSGSVITVTLLDKKGLEAARGAIHQMDRVFGLLYTVPPGNE